MRVQDWLADRFSFVQYAVPRVDPTPRPAIDWPLVRSRARDVLIGFGALLVVLHEIAKALSPRAGQPPVALLFAIAAIAAVPGLMIVTLL